MLNYLSVIDLALRFRNIPLINGEKFIKSRKFWVKKGFKYRKNADQKKIVEPETGNNALDNNSELQRHVLVVYPSNNWPELSRKRISAYKLFIWKQRIGYEKTRWYNYILHTVQAVYCTAGYSFLILAFTWIQGLPVVIMILVTSYLAYKSPQKI